MTRQVSIFVTIPNTGGRLVSGLFAEGRVAQQARRALVVPLTAVNTAIPRPRGRPGNKRVDGYRNVLERPHVGTLFLIPGRGDTLRINGTARILADADYFDAMTVKGKRPILALEIDVEEVFFHCAKAFLRSDAWDPSTWNPTAVPSVAQIAKAIRYDWTQAELDARYSEANMRKVLY